MRRHDFRISPAALFVGIIGLGLGMVASARFDVSGLRATLTVAPGFSPPMYIVRLAIGIAFAVPAFLVTRFALARVLSGTESAMGILTGASRRDATAEVPLSLVEAAIARGDHALTVTLFDELTTAHPGDRGVLRAAAQYHARHGDAQEACALLRRLRVAVPDQELYATQRLVDLYLERVREPARALPELRRIVERFPGSPEAAGAGRALRELREAGAVALS